MDRRNFLRGVTAAGVAGVGGGLAACSSGPTETRVVTYEVKGYTCATCPVGLETLLRKEKGVTRAEASYERNNVVVGFDENLVTEQQIQDFIRGFGFSIL